jgi:hypothetical protein
MSCQKREQLAKAFIAATIELEKATEEMEDFLSDAFPRVLTGAYTRPAKRR